MKLPFQKKQSQTPVSTMPPEVQQYYQAEKRERTWVAWLLAIGTLLVTVAIIAALFLAGRWVYRKVTHKNTTPTTTQTQSETQKSQNTSNQPTNGSSSNSGSSSGNTPTPSPTPPTSSPTPTPSSPNSGGVVPPTAARTSIPNTGPGDTVALFIGVSVLGYLLHRFILAKD